MRLLILLVSVFFGANSYAVELPPDLAQSSPSIRWMSIENDSVRLIYPDYLGAESVYIANLIEHYSQFVGQTYGIAEPRLFNLVLRPEMAQPNGFVGLMPRRSEWFASSMFFPFVGSTEWYQTLAIHEYRHVNQFDNFDKKGTKLLHYLMGEMGQQLAVAMSLPSWYMEGDAVWAETKYTDGGRGRSPRFSARLKALVLSEQIPTYDQFLSGSYRTELPNQYVYGYYLISYATQKFGEDVWSKITNDVARFPRPMRLYQSFETITGQSFQSFYDEAMQDLRKKWSVDAPPLGQAVVDFRDHSAVFKTDHGFYFVRQTLDVPAALYREHKGVAEKVFEFYFDKELMSMDVGRTKAVFTEFRPDRRYQYKGSSELVVVDLATGSKNTVTADRRIYNPRFNKSETKVIAADFTVEQTWNISEFDLQGQLLQTFALPHAKVAEVSYLDDSSAIVLLQNKTGQKSIVQVDLGTKSITREIVPPSRNLLHSLHVDKKNNILFEAQYKGHNEIFKIDGSGFARCTESKLGAYSPYSDGEHVYYSNQDTFGSVVGHQALSACKPLPAADLVNFNYLGNSPSDSYNSFVPQAFPEQAELYTKNVSQYQPKPYGDFDSELFIPHTWGLDLGRGGGLGFKTDNYLHTLGFSGGLGTSSEEGQAYADLSFDIKKYYPIFRFQIEDRNRQIKDFDSGNHFAWEEATAGLAVLVPYVKKYGLYNLGANLTLSGSYVDVANYKLNEAKTAGSSYFYKTYSDLKLALYKDGSARSIMAPWLLGYSVRYDDAHQPSDSSQNVYRVLQQATLQAPGVFDNDGFKFIYDEQMQNEKLTSYRFLPQGSVISYVFSRGYTYQSVPRFQKVSGDYIFPVAYPDWNLGRWYYLKRIYATAFFDSTYVNDVTLKETLNSYGVEIYLESHLLSFLPFTFGFRVLQRLSDNMVKGEGFLATTLQF